MSLEFLKFLHIIGACVLLGTGAGIAFFMLIANRRGTAAEIAHVAGIVVLADFLFTATAVIVQPVTGWMLARAAGWPLTEPWILLSLGLYIMIGLFWLPVVWIQMQLHHMAQSAAASGTGLPDRYNRLYRIWLICGFPAFAAVMAILWLMISKPDIRLF